MKKSIIYLFSLLFIFSLTACSSDSDNDGNGEKPSEILNFTEYNGNFLGTLSLTSNDTPSTYKNVNFKVESVKDANELNITISKFKPETRADFEPIVIKVPASIEGKKCIFELENAEFGEYKDIVLKGEIVNKEIVIDGSFKDETGQVVKLSFEGAIDNEAEAEEATNFADFSGDYLGNLGFSEDQDLKNINVNVVGVNGVKELTLTFSKLTNAANFEPVTVTVPARIEDGKCMFSVKDLTIATLLNVELEGVIADKVLKLEGTSTVEGETVNLSFEGAIGNEVVEEEATNFADFSGDYLGNLGFSENQDLKNINVNVVGVNGVKELTLTFSKKTNAANFEPVTVTVPARIEDGKCIFSVKDLTIATLLNVELEGVIAGKVLKLEGTSTVEGETVNLSFEGEIGKELEEEVEFTGTYNGVSYLTISEITNKFSTTNVVVENTDKVDELSFTINNLKLANTPLTYKFNSIVSVDGMSANIAEQAVLIEGLSNVVVSGGISANKELTLKFVGKDAQNLDVKFEFGVTKEVVIIEKQIADWDFSNLIKKYSGKNLNSFVPAPIAPFSWDSSDGGVQSLLTLTGKASKYGLSDVGGAIQMETLDTKGAPAGWISPATPKVTSGSLFLGTFKLVMARPLESTNFGVVIDQKVTKISGRYKYSSGQTYFECTNPGPKTSHIVVEKPGQNDEGILAAVIYDSTDGTILNGSNVYTSDKVVVKKMINVADVSNYTDFNLVLDYNFDDSKIYRLALIFSSSKDGDKFSGSPGSKLCIDDVKIFAETVSYK